MCRRLGITTGQLAQLRREGLPAAYTKPLGFDLVAVRQWLLERGLAAEASAAPEPAPLVQTLSAVAQHFDVSEKTAQTWRKQGMPRLEDGRYDLAAIEAWRVARFAPRAGGGDEDRAGLETDIARIRRDKEQIKLDQLRGTTAPTNISERVLARTIGVATTQLEDLPDQLVSQLPDGIDDEARVMYRAAVVSAVDKLRRSLADGLEEWAEALQELDVDGRS